MRTFALALSLFFWTTPLWYPLYAWLIYHFNIGKKRRDGRVRQRNMVDWLNVTGITMIAGSIIFPFSKISKEAFGKMITDFLNYQLVSPDWGFYADNRIVYQLFNVLEGIFWIGLALYVVRRKLVDAERKFEIYYAISFVLFGLTDFVEAWQMPLWLLLAKGLFLGMILYHRYRVLVNYPGKKF